RPGGGVRGRQGGQTRRQGDRETRRRAMSSTRSNRRATPARGPTRRVSLSPCLLVSLSLLTAGCDPPGKPNPADRPVPADQVADFTVLYKTHCAGCHGADGKLGPAPPLNDPLFLAIVPDEELRRVIRGGRAVTPQQKSPMPAFALGEGRPLSPEQAEAWAR